MRHGDALFATFLTVADQLTAMARGRFVCHKNVANKASPCHKNVANKASPCHIKEANKTFHATYYKKRKRCNKKCRTDMSAM